MLEGAIDSRKFGWSDTAYIAGGISVLAGLRRDVLTDFDWIGVILVAVGFYFIFFRFVYYKWGVAYFWKASITAFTCMLVFCPIGLLWGRSIERRDRDEKLEIVLLQNEGLRDQLASERQSFSESRMTNSLKKAPPLPGPEGVRVDTKPIPSPIATYSFCLEILVTVQEEIENFQIGFLFEHRPIDFNPALLNTPTAVVGGKTFERDGKHGIVASVADPNISPRKPLQVHVYANEPLEVLEWTRVL